MLRPRVVTVHRMIDTAHRSEVNVTVVKRNRGALLAQRSLSRRRLDHVWASGHNHAWQAPRFLRERKLAQRRLRGRVPNWHRVPCEGPEAQQIWDALSLSQTASSMLRPRVVTVHRMIDTAHRSEVNMTVVKRNRGALLAQRSLPRRRLDHVWASGHNHAWQALRAHDDFSHRQPRFGGAQCTP